MRMTPATLAFVSILLFGSNVAGRPKPQTPGFIPNPKQQCQDYSGGEQEVEDVVQTEYDGDMELVTGSSCRAPCIIGETDTWSKSFTVSLGGFNGPAELATKAWSFLAKAAINPGVSWTTSTAQGISKTVTCPGESNALSCGLAAWPRMALIKGRSRLANSDSALCNSELLGWHDFEIRSPVTTQTWNRLDVGKGTKDDARVDWGACVMYCQTEEACITAREAGLLLCPGTEEPEHWNAITDKALMDAVVVGLTGKDPNDEDKDEGDKQE